MQEDATSFLRPSLGEQLHHQPDAVLLLLLFRDRVHFAAWQQDEMPRGCQHSLFANRVRVRYPGTVAVPHGVWNESI